MKSNPLRRKRLPCTFIKACYALWLVRKVGLTQTQASHIVAVNVGSISHVINGRRFPNAYPVPLPD